jgi:hypothetical protein
MGCAAQKPCSIDVTSRSWSSWLNLVILCVLDEVQDMQAAEVGPGYRGLGRHQPFPAAAICGPVCVRDLSGPPPEVQSDVPRAACPRVNSKLYAQYAVAFMHFHPHHHTADTAIPSTASVRTRSGRASCQRQRLRVACRGSLPAAAAALRSCRSPKSPAQLCSGWTALRLLTRSSRSSQSPDSDPGSQQGRGCE